MKIKTRRNFLILKFKVWTAKFTPESAGGTARSSRFLVWSLGESWRVLESLGRYRRGIGRYPSRVLKPLKESWRVLKSIGESWKVLEPTSDADLHSPRTFSRMPATKMWMKHTCLPAHRVEQARKSSEIRRLLWFCYRWCTVLNARANLQLPAVLVGGFTGVFTGVR